VLTNDRYQKTRLTLGGRGPALTLLQLPGSKPADPSLPATIPAMPKSLLQLQLLLSEDTLHLASIAGTIRSDIGLSLALLRLAAAEIDGCTERVLPVSDLIVLVGIQRIRTMVEECVSVTSGAGHNSSFAACERFWMHSRLTAHVAEELAGQVSDSSNEEAFFAGLFYQLSAIPLDLHWNRGATPTRDAGELAYELAVQWNLPPILADVIRGRRDLCRSSRARALFDLASAASTWAYRLEFLAARESETIRAAIPPYIYRLPLERQG
jgi:HD-like signal output (HDOD) protein